MNPCCFKKQKIPAKRSTEEEEEEEDVVLEGAERRTRVLWRTCRAAFYQMLMTSRSPHHREVGARGKLPSILPIRS
jgi:hypothetical protein